MRAGNHLDVVLYMIRFWTKEGPSIWEGIVAASISDVRSKGRVLQLEQYSRYQRHAVCADKRVPLGFCVCQNFV